MAENYQKIGDYISVIDNRNTDGNVSNLMGISIDKCYIPSVANVIGTDLNNYKVIRKGQFACSLMQVSRDQRIPIAMYENDAPAIMSPAYVMFEVTRPEELLPEYMELWFKRAEFDREASFYAVGGVRGSLDWEDFCKMELPVPTISEQQRIVQDYKVITDRIELLRKINSNLRSIATTEFANKIRNVSDSNEELSTSDLGTFPAQWEIVTLGDVLSTIIDHRGITPLKLGGNWSKEGIIALSAKCVKNHELINLDSANRVNNELYERWMPEKLQPHDILMTSEAPLGEFYYVAAYSEYCLSQRLFALRANTRVIEPSVLYFQLTDEIGLHEIDVRKTGTTVFGIRQSELIKVPIVLPPKAVQEEFATLCDPILLEIEKNADQCRLLIKIQNLLFSGFQADIAKGA